MLNQIRKGIPEKYNSIDHATRISAFTMRSGVMTSSLLKTLAASKPNGRFLELGTGTGLSASWILDGMNTNSA